MTDILTILSNLHRPRLLVWAARFGLKEYSRDQDLKRVMKSGNTPTPLRAVNSLIVEEAELEATRKTGTADYGVSRHVDVLIA